MPLRSTDLCLHSDFVDLGLVRENRMFHLSAYLNEYSLWCSLFFQIVPNTLVMKCLTRWKEIKTLDARLNVMILDFQINNYAFCFDEV